MKKFLSATLYWAFLIATAQADPAKLTIGVLAFGTVNWELASMRNEGLDRKYGLDLQVQTLASPDAGKIGLHADSLDMIVSDWIWVANQQQTGADYRFIPYSTQAGALMAPADTKIKGIPDLAGKRLGIVGGPLDKNWILLRALAQKQYGLNLDAAVEKVFAAPPLLNQQLGDGKLDALLNFWHYAAKLEAQGFHRVMDGRDIVKRLGFDEPPANLGYVFRRRWGEANKPALEAFLKASAEARQRLCDNAASWEKIAPLTGEQDEKLQASLRREYCSGLVKHWTAADRQTLADIYALLRQTGGDQLTGKAEKLPMEIFWTYSM